MGTDRPGGAARLGSLRERWQRAWPAALEAWSRYTQLTEPRWCMTAAEEKEQQLSGSFAMIRLADHAVVISLRQIDEMKLESFALEILAHEIGHHVYCPADLTDNAMLLARIRAGLPTREHLAPLVANLYTDLLINDRLQRSCGLDLAGIYSALAAKSADRMWTLYMRVYEILWNLPRATLAGGVLDPRLDSDAALGARVVRSYARDWLEGAGRFACLCLPYLIEDEGKALARRMAAWHDTRDAGRGGMPSGMTEVDDAEISGAIHPSEDAALSGLGDAREGAAAPSAADTETGIGPADGSGHKSLKRLRQPFEYAEVIKASGADLPQEQVVARYYRELAMPHLVRFPVRENPPSAEPQPEGLDTWDVGSAVDEIDWLQSAIASPTIIPGVTTRRRMYGSSPGAQPESTPVDLYLGVDCSGSMGNPARQLSYPVLAGAIIALSALRVGARVMVALSGEPGRTITTDGFVRDEALVLGTLTSYLGTGTTFGIHRLADTFRGRRGIERPVHILIVTDNDIFSMLDQKQRVGEGWAVAREALQSAGGGGTMVLQLPQYLMQNEAARDSIHPGCRRLEADGWAVANVNAMEDLLAFAKEFSRRAYASPMGGGSRR